jgi:hypothetical protein
MAYTRWKTNKYITTWPQFHQEVRLSGHRLLPRLKDFPNAILITGCQRSGTTMLTRIINLSDELTKYWFGPDEELDSALILSGYVDHRPEGRYCFQTTYVNRAYYEYYYQENQFKLIWVLRNPVSVIYSMLNNWHDFSLGVLFSLCGAPRLAGFDALRFRLIGEKGLSKLRRACWAYNGKVSQLFELMRNIEPDKLIVIDYDDLVINKESVLPKIYSSLDLGYKREYAERIHSKSVDKGKLFRQRDLALVYSLCEPIYKRAKEYVTYK